MNIEKEYQASLNFIYSFIDLSVTRQLRYSEEKFDLTRMVALMSLLGDPQLNYDVIHVAGTKGKGSICAMMASILREAGYKVGQYSSPHMIDFRERIKINNADIPKKAFIEYVKKYELIFLQHANVSTFEIITAIAFQYFSDQKVDIAVIEVGMGGRLDATNVVQPIISIISSISHDHTKILGNTLPEIAREKAGIIKLNTPVIISPQKRSVKKEIMSVAENKHAQLIDVTEQFSYEQMAFSLQKQTFKILPKVKKDLLPEEIVIDLHLIGDHQIENALTAYSGTRKLIEMGYRIDRSNIQIGFAKTKWPGRFEVIHTGPLVIVDGAHNLDSFRRLRETIKKYLPEKQISMVFGASEDKNVRSMLNVIEPYINDFIFTATNHPRAMETEILASIAKSLEINKYSVKKVEDIIPMFEDKMNLNTIYLVTGSIFLAGAISQLVSDWEKLNK